jgi:para-aminobenzoate synthetase/4-amino-4-deoxychorismate lyase
VALSGAWCGGGTLLSSHPAAIAEAGEDPFALFDRLPRVSSVPDAVGGGWLGWLGFGLAARVEALPPSPPRPEATALFDLAFHDHVVRCDDRGDWWFEALWTEERAAVLTERREWWQGRLGGQPPEERPFRAEPLRPVGAGLAGHERAVAEAVARIAAGELSQVNLGLRLEGAFEGDPLDLWVRATVAAQPDYAAFIGCAAGDRAAVSLSPELFLQRRSRAVRTRPVKGTAAADSDPAGLSASAKDRAENVMIVDLMRNDLGRVCAYGSISVEELCGLGRGPGVWQLESTVAGRLRDDVRDSDLLRAAFPPGSVTGAPKVQALKTIHELEGTAREAYCGAIALSSPLSGLELSVAIRTLECSARRIWLGVGGGIVADSEPAGEVREALTKARGVTAAAGLDLEVTDNGTAPRRPIIRIARPDPGAGLFETLKVVGGRPHCLPSHLARLRASAATLGLDIPESIEADALRAARVLGDGGLRITVDGRGARVEGRPRPVARPVRLTPIVLPGGLGAHKWADREPIRAHSGPDSTPLICDLDGSVLEAGYAAVLIAADGGLVAPVLDGRQLPSLSRQRLLRAVMERDWPVWIRSIELDELAEATAIILTSSLRGPHLAVLDGADPGRADPAICGELQRLWAS